MAVTADRPPAAHRDHMLLARLALVPFAVILVAATACSSDRAQLPASTPSESTSTTGPAAATEPAVAPGAKDCGTQNSLVGWPTTFVPAPDAYACILDALATGTPAQMTAIYAGSNDSGRQSEDGYDLPTRRIVTWLVLAENKVQETIDLTEDGDTSTTRTCTGLTRAGISSPLEGTDCS